MKENFFPAVKMSLEYGKLCQVGSEWNFSSEIVCNCTNNQSAL